MKAISLFSGAGGFELGFQRAGIETMLQAENDPWCLSVLAHHWPDTERVCDVRDVGGQRAIRRCPERASLVAGQQRPPPVDLVYGGFPCQDVSVAGARAGFRGERSSLWFEFERVLSELRPRWTVIENVPGLLSSGAQPSADFGRVLRGLVDLGYGVAWRVLDARWFGVPQRRRRVFIVGCLGDAPRAAQVLAVCESCGGHSQARAETGQAIAASLRSRSANAGVNMPGRGGEDDSKLIAFGGNNTSGPIGIAAGRSSRANRLDFDTDTFLLALDIRNGTGGKAAHTLQSAGIGSERGGNPNATPHRVQSQGVRRLTPLECERLMGWPDEYTRWAADGREIPDSHRYRMCGNGVVATVAEWIGHRLVRTNAFIEAAA